MIDATSDIDNITPDIEAITKYSDNINAAHATHHQNDASTHAGLALLDQKRRSLQGLRWAISSIRLKCCKLSVHDFNAYHACFEPWDERVQEKDESMQPSDAMRRSFWCDDSIATLQASKYFVELLKFAV